MTFLKNEDNGVYLQCDDMEFIELCLNDGVLSQAEGICKSLGGIIEWIGLEQGSQVLHLNRIAIESILELNPRFDAECALNLFLDDWILACPQT